MFRQDLNLCLQHAEDGEEQHGGASSLASLETPGASALVGESFWSR